VARPEIGADESRVRASSENRTRTEDFLALFDDEGAFRRWYDGTLPGVYAFVLYRCGGVRSVAMEITQEAFVEAFRHRARFDGRSAPSTWICGIARHKLADHFRRRAREERRHVSLAAIPDLGEADHEEWERSADAREDVLRALRTIPPVQGAVLALHYLDGMSVREIARTLDRTEKAAESLLSRGRENFKRAFGPASRGGSDA
jgi:RNA polymerase sigma-70 factor, ECF subfamily